MTNIGFHKAYVSVLIPRSVLPDGCSLEVEPRDAKLWPGAVVKFKFILDMPKIQLLPTTGFAQVLVRQKDKKSGDDLRSLFFIYFELRYNTLHLSKA